MSPYLQRFLEVFFRFEAKRNTILTYLPRKHLRNARVTTVEVLGISYKLI